MIIHHDESYFERVPIEKQRVCCNCKNRQIEPSRCMVHGVFLHYETVFTGWCRHWKGDNESTYEDEVCKEYEYLHWDTR